MSTVLKALIFFYFDSGLFRAIGIAEVCLNSVLNDFQQTQIPNHVSPEKLADSDLPRLCSWLPVTLSVIDEPSKKKRESQRRRPLAAKDSGERGLLPLKC